MECSTCAAGNDSGARFCSSCGREFAHRESPAIRRTVTVVFCDMVGSTALSERLDAEALRQVMLRYYAVTRGCLERHGGTVEKFIGDAVMAVFGVPVLHEDDALRAARAAVEMLAAVRELGDDLERDFGARISARIGVNTGEVVASGDPGSGHTLVSGEAVNVAARLEQHAPTGDALIGEDTYRLVRGAVTVDPWPALTVKGKSQPVPAHRLLAVDPRASAVPRSMDAPLVNRHHELAQLRLVHARVERDRTCQLVTLYGDPGVGKSRLVREYVDELGRLGAQVVTTQCLPYGDGGSLQPLSELLHQLLGESPPARVAAVLGVDEPARAVGALLARLMSTGSTGTAVRETCWAVRQVFTALGRERPLVAVLDDLHWGRPDFLDVIDHLADWVSDAPVMLLCLARPDLLDQRAQWGSGKLNATALVVPPLTDADCRELVLRLLDTTGDTSAVVPAHETFDLELHGAPAALGFAGAAHTEQVVERSGGNPLFAEQMVAMVRDGGGSDGFPPSVRSLLAARLDRLTPPERTLLECAAVVGRTFTASRVGDLLPANLTADPDTVDATLRSLVRRRLLEADGDGNGFEIRYRFTGVLVRDVVYDGTSKLLRAERHELVAELITRHEPGDRASIGGHLEQAFRRRRELGPCGPQARAIGERAVAYLEAEGSAAVARGDVHWAVEALQRAVHLRDLLGAAPVPPGFVAHGFAAPGFAAGGPAVDDGPRPGLGTGLAAEAMLAEARLATGDAAAATAALRSVETRARAVGDRPALARVRLQLAYLEPGADGFGASLVAAEEAIEVFTAAGDDLGLGRAWLRIGQERQSRGRYHDALERFERALEHSVRADALLEQAGILGALAVSLWLGPEPAPLAIDRCLDLIGTHLEGRLLGQAAVSCPLAVLLALRGRFDEARERLARAEQTLTDLGHAFALPSVRLFAASVESLDGRWGEAETQLRAARAELARLGDRQLHETAGRELARTLVAQNRFDEAVTVIGDPEEPGPGLDQPTASASLHGLWARVAAARGDAPQALRHAAAATRAAGRTDSPACLAEAALDQARAAAALDLPDPAARAAAEAVRHFTAKGHLPGIRQARDLRSRAASPTHDPATGGTDA